MKITEGMRKAGLSVGPDCTLQKAAELMECNAVGALAVVEDGTAVGIVTDRDLVRRAVARGVAPDARIDSVMTSPVVSISADADFREALDMFRRHPIRRLVIERDGSFVGVVSADDLLIDLASDLAAVVRPIGAEVMFGHRDSPVPTAV